MCRVNWMLMPLNGIHTVNVWRSHIYVFLAFNWLFYIMQSLTSLNKSLVNTTDNIIMKSKVFTEMSTLNWFSSSSKNLMQNKATCTPEKGMIMGCCPCCEKCRNSLHTIYEIKMITFFFWGEWCSLCPHWNNCPSEICVSFYWSNAFVEVTKPCMDKEI